jgi:hypothetical protein
MNQSATYAPPPHGWTCFHCGETFMHEQVARTHFGTHPGVVPGCLERVGIGEDRGLLRKLRIAQKEVELLRSDINDEISSSHAFYSRLAFHLKSFAPFRDCRSLQDVFNVYDSMEGRAIAAEERLAASAAVPNNVTGD